MTDDPIDVVASYYERFGAKDESCVDLVAEDATFQGPAAEAEGKEAIDELNAGFFPALDGVEVLHRSAAGDTVATQMRFDLSTPDGDSLTVEMTEIDEVRDGRIVGMKTYYDPREFLEAFAPSA